MDGVWVRRGGGEGRMTSAEVGGVMEPAGGKSATCLEWVSSAGGGGSGHSYCVPAPSSC